MLKTRNWRLVCAAVSVLACGVASVQAQGDAQAQKASPAVAAYIGGEPILLQDVDAKALKTDMKLAQSMYDARRVALDAIIMERLLAKEAAAQNITVDQLIDKRVAEKTTPVTDADVEAFFNSNQARMGGRTLEQVGPQIKSYLQGQNATAARTAVLDEVKKTADIKVSIDPPRAEVILAANDPTQGSPSAKVTVAIYSDFQ